MNTLEYSYFYNNGIKTHHKKLINLNSMKKESKNASSVKIFYGNKFVQYFVNELYFYEVIL